MDIKDLSNKIIFSDLENAAFVKYYNIDSILLEKDLNIKLNDLSNYSLTYAITFKYCFDFMEPNEKFKNISTPLLYLNTYKRYLDVHRLNEYAFKLLFSTYVHLNMGYGNGESDLKQIKSLFTYIIKKMCESVKKYDVFYAKHFESTFFSALTSIFNLKNDLKSKDDEEIKIFMTRMMNEIMQMLIKYANKNKILRKIIEMAISKTDLIMVSEALKKVDPSFDGMTSWDLLKSSKDKLLVEAYDNNNFYTFVVFDTFYKVVKED